MTHETVAPISLCLRLDAPCPHAGDLAPALARGLGLSPADVRTETGGAGVLVLSLPAPLQRVAALARAFGLEVIAPAVPARLGLAFLPRPGAEVKPLALRIAALAGRSTDEVETGMSQAGGFALPDLTAAVALDWKAAARRIAGVEAVILDRAAAVFDLFGAVEPVLAADLRRLALSSCAVTGAQAAGLDAATAAWLLRRHGVRALDRVVQRFDLQLTGCGRLAAAEAADFLVPRSGLSRGAVAAATARRPVVLERSLPRPVALRFLADYAQIGLCVRLRLVGRVTGAG